MTETTEMLQWETVKMRVADLVPHIKNPKKWKPKGQEQLAESLRKYGVAGGLRCTLDGRLLDGHGRCEELVRAGLGDLEIDVSRCTRELTPEEEADLLSRFAINNRTWDFDILKNDELFQGLDLEGIGFDAEVLKELAPPKVLKAEDDDYVPPAEVVTDIVLGDLFEFRKGDLRHRLLCGDSTIIDDVQKLMGGEQADICFTDPPYGVNVKGGAKSNKSIAGDITQTVIPFSFDLAVLEATKPKARFYFCGGESNIGMYQKLFDRYLRQLPRHLIWVKNGFVMKPNNYHNQYEILYFGFKEGGGDLKHWYGERTEDAASDVWQIKRDASGDYLHPTQKPIDLASRAIKNSCPPNGSVYEPFCGSGSTMVACHQLERNCFAIEFDPYYCQVIVQRMRKLDPALEVWRNGERMNFEGDVD